VSGGAKAHDLKLLDALDALPRLKFAGPVWRVVRDGRDPIQSGPSRSRWCDGTFDVLYTSMERDGAIAEVHAFWSLQPVFPSKIDFRCFELTAAADHSLQFLDVAALKPLGVDPRTYADRDYAVTSAIASAANFLGFDGLIAPSARWKCQNVMLFTEHAKQSQIALKSQQPDVIDWVEWRARTRRQR
jgi:RES domain-containing protein